MEEENWEDRGRNREISFCRNTSSVYQKQKEKKEPKLKEVEAGKKGEVKNNLNFNSEYFGK